ncbi:fucose isomerase [Clostridium sp. chh4-2]|uniref:L-fucose/L-arabinose isomerase family protein n=1 Tax=Clostridium sp. chh4-2 TaxID=2067550 RepID=UPI000CCF0229|nr:fucose isomerase [Clostridium sp. chh4-2]PNV63410.1 fucose isomerase [Clostridium sp. chh4-2]
MKKQLNVGFLTTFSGRWPQEVPSQRNKEYGDWLEANLPELNIIRADVMGSGLKENEAIVSQFKAAEADVIVMVYGAFTGDDVASYLTEMLNIPILLWAPYEVPFEKDDRLYSNALCSMTMNSAALRKVGVKCHTVYGSKEDERAAKKVKSILMAYHVVKCMKHTNLGLLGYRPTAFYNCSFDESLIRRTFGIKIEETDLKVVFDKMDALDKDLYEADMKEMSERFDTSQLPEGHLENHSKLYLAVKEVMAAQGYDFGTLKCWPEMGNLHTTPCAVLGRLADDGINIGCEGDVDAEIAQIAEYYLTGQPSFITDMINIDEDKNLMTFWHCGNAAPSLCNPNYDVLIRNHPLAGQGTAFYGALKPGTVTIARFCNMGGQYKLFLMGGESVDMDRYTKGIMANIKVKAPVREVIERIIEEGVPHHYSLVWADVRAELKEICALLDIEVIEL